MHILTHPALFVPRYGQLLNIRLKSDGQRDDPTASVVQFADIDSAARAIKDPSAVLGNRFIKVLFAWPTVPVATEEELAKFRAISHVLATAAAAAKADAAASHPAAPTASSGDGASGPPASGDKGGGGGGSVDGGSQSGPSLAALMELQAKQQALLDEQLAQQKQLFAKLEASEDAAEKKLTVKAIAALSKLITPQTATVKAMLLQVEAARKAQVGNTPSRRWSQDGEAGASSRGRRGRGRGRGRARGAGGAMAPRGSTTLDNRTTSIKVEGPVGDTEDNLRAHYSVYGELNDCRIVEADAVAVVNFKLRKSAEEALARGGVYNGQTLKAAWHEEEVPALDEAATEAAPEDNPDQATPAQTADAASPSLPTPDEATAEDPAGEEAEGTGSMEVEVEAELDGDAEEERLLAS